MSLVFYGNLVLCVRKSLKEFETDVALTASVPLCRPSAPRNRDMPQTMQDLECIQKLGRDCEGVGEYFLQLLGPDEARHWVRDYEGGGESG